jgi:WD40 repeat protein
MERDKALKAQAGEEKQRKEAQASALLAQEQKQRAEVQELAAREIAYAANINLVQQSLAANLFGKSKDLLDELRPKPGQRDLRGWEWRFLWQQRQSEALFTLCRRPPSVTRLAVSANGRWVAMNGGGGLSIWDLRTREEIDRPKAGDDLSYFAFVPNQPWLAFSEATGSDSTNPVFAIHIRDVAAHRNFVTIPLHGECRGLAFSRDGKTLITFTDPPDKQITLWSMPSGQRQLSYPTPHFWQWQGTSFAVAQDASVAAYANSDVTGPATVQVIDLKSGTNLWCKRVSDDAMIQSLAISPDHRVLASGAGFADPDIQLWDLASGQELSTLSGHLTYCQALAFSPDGKTLVSASADQTLRVWDVSNPSHPEAKEVLHGHQDEVHSVAWIPGSTRLVSGGKDGTVCVWDAAKARDSRGPAIVRLVTPITAWRFSADGQSVLAVAQDGTVARCYGSGFQHPEPLLCVGTNLSDALISEDCKWLAAGLSNGVVEVWDLERRTRTRQLHSEAGLSVPSAFLRRGKHLLLSDWGRIYEEWDLTAGQKVTNWPGPATWKSRPVVRGERWCLMTGQPTKDAPNQIILRDLQTGQQSCTNLSQGDAYGGAISPNGEHLAVPNSWGRISVFRIPTLEPVVAFRGFFQGAHSTAYSPDGSRLAVGGGGIEAVKLFDSTNYRELLTLPGKGTIFWDTQFSQDGNWLGSVNLNGGLHLWRAPSSEEIAALEAKQKADSERAELAADQAHRKIVSPLGFLEHWLVLAPIPLGSGQNGVEGLEIEQVKDEARLRPKAGEKRSTAADELKWRQVHLKDDVIDFNALVGKETPHSVAYAVCYVRSETEQRGLQMLVGSDDESKIYLNGTEVYKSPTAGAFNDGEQDTVPDIVLKAGVNVLVFKVVNETLGWKGGILFADVQGNPVTGIKAMLDPESSE